MSDTLKILILEDDDADAEILQRLLKRHGDNYLFSLVMTREKYIDALAEFTPDVILSDNALPQFSATEALDILKQCNLAIPFILVTGTVSEEFAAGIIRSGADDYLLKDRLARLPGAIEAAIQKKKAEKEKQEAVERLKESEAKYRSIMERVTDAFVAVDRNGNYTYVNKKAADLLSSTPEEMLGKNIWGLFPEAIALPFYDAFYRALNEQRYSMVENYSPSHDIWLENHIYPSPDGLSIFFNDVTAKKKAEEKLKASEEKYRLLIDRMSDGFITLDKDWKYTYVNSRYAELSQRAAATLIGKNVWEEFPAAVGTAGYQSYQKGMEERTYQFSVFYFASLDIWVENHVYPAPDGGIFVFIRDITANKKAEEKIIKTNRLYFFISQINQMIVRTKDDATLFEEVCRIAVEVGEFKMAWFGIVDERTQQVLPVKIAGEKKELLTNIKTISVADDNELTKAGKAIREGKYIISDDLEEEEAMNPWQDKALSKGYHACMILPVKKFGKLIGTFAVYAAEKFFFDDDEVVLLEEAAGDVSFALEVFALEKQRKEAELTVQLSEEKYISLVDSIDGIVWEADAKTFAFNFISKQAERLLGYPTEDWIQNPTFWKDHIYEEDRNWAVAFCASSTKAKKPHEFEYRMITATGSLVWLRDIVTVIVENDKPVMLRGIMIDITERKKAEEAIRNSEKRYQTLAEASPVGIFHTDVAGFTTYVNPCWTTIAGMQYEDALGNGWLDAVHPEDRDALMAGWNNATKEQHISISEYRFVHKDGSIAWVMGQAIPERNEFNEIIGYVGTTTDITERKKIEERIASSNERFELITSAAKDALWDWNLATDKIWANEVHQQLYGLSMADPVPRFEDWKERVHPEDRHYVLALLENAKADGTKLYSYEYRFKIYTGEWINVYSRTLIQRDQKGKPIRLIGSTTDITERKKAELAIIQSEEKYRTLVDQATDGIFIADPSGRFIMVNPAGCKMAGYTMEEMQQLTIYDLVDKEELKKNPFRFEEMYQPQGGNSQRKMVRKDGVLVDIEISAKFLSDQRFIAFIRDITQRLKAEEAIRFSEEKYRSLVDEASDAIFIADAAGNFITVNPSAARISKYSEEELLHMSFYDFFVEEDLQKRPLNIDRLTEGKTVISERLMKIKGGGTTNIEITAKLLNDGRMLSFVKDISERIKTQNDIIHEKNLSDSIINSLPGIFYLYDKEGKFLRWNKNFEKVTLYTAAEISRMHPIELFADDEKELLAKKIANVFVTGEDNVQANLLIKTKKKVPYYFTGIAIDYQGETCLMGVGIDFSERVKDQQKIKDASEQLRQLAIHLQSVREEERKRIGREIHDELGQQLTAIKMDVSWIDKKIPEETLLLKDKLKNIISLLDGSNQSIRRILSELRPGILDDYGLIEAIEWLNRQFTQNTGVPVEFITTETDLKLPEPVTTCIFRVYQEALTNITRYADAGKVVSSLKIEDKMIHIVIKDDGNGFDTLATKTKQSFGILGMKERVKALNGKFNLVSSPGKGTELTMQLPYKP